MLPRGEWQSEGHRERYGGYYQHTKVIGWSPSSALARELRDAASPSHDIYQFGVYTGGTMKGIAKRIPNFGHLWGFDSFTGLPEESPGVRLEGKHWNRGGFSAADALAEHNERALLERIYTFINRANTTLIRGYFNESLSAGLVLRHRFQPALYVDIDVDLYSSTVYCMSWLLSNNLLLPGLSYVRYDDWRNKNQNWGEPVAHRLITRMYKLSWRRITLKEYQLIGIGATPDVELVKERAFRNVIK